MLLFRREVILSRWCSLYNSSIVYTGPTPFAEVHNDLVTESDLIPELCPSTPLSGRLIQDITQSCRVDCRGSHTEQQPRSNQKGWYVVNHSRKISYMFEINREVADSPLDHRDVTQSDTALRSPYIPMKAHDPVSPLRVCKLGGDSTGKLWRYRTV